MTLLSDIRARERAERRSNIEQDLSGGSLPALRRTGRAVTVVQEMPERARGGSGDLSLVVASSFASPTSKARADFVCDTYNNNDAIIQAAIDQLTNDGVYGTDSNQPGRIMLTEGSFYFNAPVTLRGCEVEGVGGYFNGTNIYPDGTTTGPLFLADTAKGGRIAHMHLNGGWDANIKVTGSGVHIENCVIAASEGPGVLLDGANDVWISGCLINGNTGGVVFTDSEQVYIDRCTFQFGNDGTGVVRIDALSQHVWLTGCYLNGQASPVGDDIVVAAGATNIFITGNVTVQEVDIAATASVVSGNVFGDGTLTLTTSIGGPNIIDGVVVA